MYVSLHIAIHTHVLTACDHAHIRVGEHARVSVRRRCTCTPRSVCAHECMYVCEHEDCHGSVCSRRLLYCPWQR